MPSTYTDNLRLELQANGENSGTWNTKYSAVFERIEDAIAGVTTVATTGGSTTLTTNNGSADEARNAVIKVTGALVSNATIVVPAVSKTYYVWNATSGAFTVTIQPLAGTGVVVPQGQVVVVMTDGSVAYTASHGGGDIEVLGTGKRIRADFTNATLANQTMFQSSTENGYTLVGAIPLGTGILAGFAGFSGPDPDNASVGSLVVRTDTSEVRLTSGKNGSGTYFPIRGYLSGLKQFEFPVAGGFQITQPALLGYGTGAGGSVTQVTDQFTPVTLNKPCGSIDLFDWSISSGGGAVFRLNNSFLTSTSIVFLTMYTNGLSGTSSGLYIDRYDMSTAGQLNILYKYDGLGTVSTAGVLINFAIINNATS